MAKVEFKEILSQQVGSAPTPQPIPEGTYYGQVDGLPTLRLAKTKEGDKPIVVFKFALTEAGDDVDEAALADVGGLLRGDGEPKRVVREFWVDESSRYRLDQFLEGFGFKDMSYEEAFQQMPGMDVQLFVTLEEYTTKTGEARSINNVQRAFART